MKTATVKCVILGQKVFGENDKLVFLYCDELGKLKVIAKGARKVTSKFTGHLETLNICEVSLYFGPRNIIITEIADNSPKTLLKENLETLASAFQIAEITDSLLMENQSLENLFTLIKKAITHLSKSERPKLIGLAYIIKLLDKVGVLPDFKQTKTKLPGKYVKFFEYLRTKHFSEIEKIILSKKEEFESQKLLSRLIERETERKFHSLTTFTTPRTFSNLVKSKSN